MFVPFLIKHVVSICYLTTFAHFFASFNAVRRDSRAISHMRPENVRIFIESAKFLLNTLAIYSNWAGDIIKTSLVILAVCNCFIDSFMMDSPLFWCNFDIKSLCNLVYYFYYIIS